MENQIKSKDFSNRYLIFEDGTTMIGTAYGSQIDAYGEVVFTTSMTGYIESITDPSYCGQMIIFASPTIANYSIKKSRMESGRIQVAAVITRDAHSTLFSGRPGEEFDRFLKDKNIPGIDGIDTRMLVRKIREEGVMKAWISKSASYPSDWPDPMKKNLVGKVSCKKPYSVVGTNEKEILFIDLGTKRSLIDRMRLIGSLKVVPYNFDFTSIKGNYDAIFISNGPGDPSHESLKMIIEFIKKSSKEKPIFGVCLGHQLISLAFGAQTKKMHFGHRGSNHAVTDGQKIWITAHNHGYIVDEKSLKKTELIVRQRDVNDGSIEMIEHLELPIFSVQYHPEASPGPCDSDWFFEKMSKVIDEVNAKR